MRKSAISIISLFIGILISNAQINDSARFSCNLQDASFLTFINWFEQETGMQFYYRLAWIDTIKVSLHENQVTAQEILQKATSNTSIGFVYTGGKSVYIIPDKKFYAELPDYKISSDIQKIAGSDNEAAELPKDNYLKGREPDMIATVVIGTKNGHRSGRYALVSAKIIQENSGEALIGATLYIRELKKGEITDLNGVLNMSLHPGKYTAEFKCMGMHETRCVLDVLSDGYFELKMKEKVNSLDEVVINAEGLRESSSKIGFDKISIKSVKELPAFMGEKDVVKISQLLPGVVSVGEGSSGVNVRGGNTDQNLFYLNNIPVYNTSHVFGFFSSINSTIVNNFSLYKGYIPAEYGGRLSSIFAIETRKGNKKRFFSQGGISPVSANIEFETPVVKEKCSLLVSGRSSYSDWLLNRLDDASLRNSSVKFGDLAGGIDYDINAKNKLSVFGYYSHDYFNYNKSVRYQYLNSGASLNYNHWFSQALKGTVSLIYSKYHFDTKDETSASEAYQHDYTLNHSELKGLLNWIPGEKNNITLGIDAINYKLERGNVNPLGQMSNINAVNLGNEQGLETSVFLDDKLQLFNWWNFSLGLRYSSFMQYGPDSVFNYANGLQPDNSNIIDTISYNKNDIIKTYGRPELRIASEIKINAYSSIKLAFIQMQQYIFMLSNTISIAPNDQWKLVDYHIKPPQSNQASIGFYRFLPALGMSSTIESYYKWSDKVIEFKDGADFLNTPNIETSVLQGKQKSYGIELLLSKDEGDLNGWISYTYSRSLMLVNGAQMWQKINNGEQYPSNYDKPHVCNLVLNYHLNRRFSLSSNVVYSTGRPITLPIAIYYIDDEPYVDYSKRNEYRIPDYFRVDMSLTIEGNLKRKKPFHSYWLISVYNLTGRNNAQSIYFRSEEGKINGYKYSVVGEPIFTVSWNFKLGNFLNN